MRAINLKDGTKVVFDFQSESYSVLEGTKESAIKEVAEVLHESKNGNEDYKNYCCYLNYFKEVSPTELLLNAYFK
jgi:hypothetical protein